MAKIDTRPPGGGGGSSVNATSLRRENIRDYGGGVEKTAAENTTAYAAARNAAHTAGHRTVYFPGGVGDYVMNSANVQTNGVGMTLVGDGPIATRIRYAGSAGAAGVLFPIISGASGVVEFRDLTFIEPSNTGSGSHLDSRITTADGAGSRTIRFRNVWTQGFNYISKTDQGVGTTDTHIDVDDCDFRGRGTASECFGIFCAQDTGSVKISRTRMRGYGKRASTLFHSLYIYDHIDVNLQEVVFSEPVGNGYAVQVFGGVAAAPNPHIIDSCTFDLSGNNSDKMRAFVSSAYTPMRVTGGHIKHQGEAFTSNGDLTVSDARIIGGNTSDYGIKFGGTGRLAMKDVSAVSNCANWLIIDQIGSIVTLDDCRVEGLTGNSLITTSAANADLRIKGGEYTPAMGAAVYEPFGATNKLRIEGNAVFYMVAGKYGLYLAVVLADLVLGDMEFNGGGDAVTSTLLQSNAANFRYGVVNNVGMTVPFRTRNNGVTSVANGGAIAHGVGLTNMPIIPKKWGVGSTVASRSTGVASVSANNLNIYNWNDTSGVVATAENINWWAEA